MTRWVSAQGQINLAKKLQKMVPWWCYAQR